MADWQVLTEPGGYAGSYLVDRGYGITVEAYVDAAHPDAGLAAIRLLREFVEARPELGPFVPEQASKPIAYRHGGETKVISTYFASAEGLAKWTVFAAAQAETRRLEKEARDARRRAR